MYFLYFEKGMETESKTYDFLIVGSGMGGLTSAVILAKEGYSVLVLEKNHQIGGNLQVFSRDKRVFDTGVHYIGGLDKGENLYQIFRYLEIMDDLHCERLDDEGYDRILFQDGKPYKHAQGYDRFEATLLQDFPDEREAIRTFCATIQDVCSYFPLYNLSVENERNYLNHPEILRMNAWEFVCSITQNEKLRAVLLGNGFLYAGEKETTPLYVVALIMNSFLKGSYRMINGGSQISRLLTKKLREHGGELRKREEVLRAHYSDGKIDMVETAQGNRYRARHFISNAHPIQTLKMFGEENFRPAFRNRLSRLENTTSSFMVYISLEEGCEPYTKHNTYWYRNEDVWEATNYSKETWPEAMFICTAESKSHKGFAESMSVMTYMHFDEVKEWNNTHNTIVDQSERGEAYEMFKREKERVVIDLLEKVFPEIRKHIRNVYSSTPLTYKDYIGTGDGSLYGIKKKSEDPFITRIDARTRIPNLYLTGQNLIFHGILGAAIGALVTSFHFVNQNDLIHKIKNS